KAQQVLADGDLAQEGVSAQCLAALDAVLIAIESGSVVQVHASAAAIIGEYDQGLPLQIEHLKHDTKAAEVAVNVPQFSFPSDFAQSPQPVTQRSTAAVDQSSSTETST